MNQKRGQRNKKSRIRQGESFQWLVAEAAKAFNSGATIVVGEWEVGPDGRRELDVTVRGKVGVRDVFLLIECKDYTYSTKARPVGIGDIDAFDSKRRDMRADLAIVASNSGFARPALLKAARTSIGAVAILKEGDVRAKARVVHDLFLRDLTFDHPISFTYFDENANVVVFENAEYGVATHLGESIDEWLVLQASAFQTAHPWEGRRVRFDFKFKAPITVVHKAQSVRVSRIEIEFRWNTQWLYQPVELDAGMALVDYIKGRIFLAPGPNTLTYRNVDFDKAEPCDPPTAEQYRMQTGFKGELLVQMVRARNVGSPKIQAESAISAAVVPEDLAAVLQPIPE